MQEPALEIRQQRFIAAAVKIIEQLKMLMVFGFVLLVALDCFRTITAFDFPWQLAEGDFILKHGHPARSVLQAYGDISPHFANEYIPYEVVISGINHFSGWLGPCLFFGMITLLIHGPCIMAFFKSRGRYPLMAAILFLIALEIIDWRLSARPELIADACYLAVGMILLRHGERPWNGPQTFWLGLLFCIWANVHGTFLVGLGMMGLWYGQMVLLNWKTILSAKDMTRIRPGMAALIGCMMNSYGPYRLIQPFELHGLLWGQATSFEMWPAPLDQAWIPLTGAVIGLVILARGLQGQKTYWLMALFFILQYLSFTSNRFSIFIGLTLLIIVWNQVTREQNSYRHASASLFSALGKAVAWLLVNLLYAEFIILLISAMMVTLHKQGRFMYPNTLIVVNSSFAWLRLQPKPNYRLLSLISEGSMAQMPGYEGIHPLLDSGTHRYSDDVNKLYYYILYDPDTLAMASSKLNVNAVLLDSYTFCWANVINKSPEWKLAQIGSDSQLYLREDDPDPLTQQKMFQRWEQNENRETAGPAIVTTEMMLRGLDLRPDEESLRLWDSIRDMKWILDPEIAYLENWLEQVPDNFIEDDLERIGDKTDDSSMAIHILDELRLRHDEAAAEVAQKWNPFILKRGYQECQELRAEAFLAARKDGEARKVLESLWPQPRYSLRWANLCRQAYADQPSREPENARLLTDLEQRSAWKDSVIARLNRNMLRFSAQ